MIKATFFFLHIDNPYQLLGDILIGVLVVFMSLVTDLSPLLLPSTNSYPHRSCFKFQSAALSVLCVRFQVQLYFYQNRFLLFLSLAKQLLFQHVN